MGAAVTVIIPTCNAGEKFRDIALMLTKQTANVTEILIIDSQSTDETVNICNEFGFTVEVINKKDFGHGKTRQYALEKVQNRFVVFMTQDALLENNDSIKNMVDLLEREEDIAAAYGRQLPYINAGCIGSFARIYNYPVDSHVNSFNDRGDRGIKTAFLSDSFAAYKKDLLLKVGGFPKHVFFGEDMYVSAKLLMAGYKTAYCSDARVYHSHDLSLKEEFVRSKQIGEFHKQEKWILDAFGKAEGEGIKFVFNEIKYLIKNGKYHYLLIAFMHNLVKFIGYKVGSRL